MPTENTRTPHIDVSRIIPWLETHWHDQHCPICGDVNWQVEAEPYRLDPIPLTHSGPRPAHRDTRVVIPVTCTTCGHMLMFDAFKTGVLWFDNTGDADDE